MPEIRMLNLIDITAPSGEVCGDDCCGPATVDPASLALPAATEIVIDAATAPSAAETFAVSGMTCGHCVAAVTKELGGLAGVESVDVDLVAGGVSRVTVSSAAPLPAEEVRAAVEAAGYSLV